MATRNGKTKTARKKPAALPLRLEWRSPAELAENPANWRRHPAPQLAALTDVIAEVGWAGACLFNERTGRLIDGHARRKVALEQGTDKVPVLVGDWTEDQERKILATLDPLAAMAEADSAALDALLKGISTDSPALNEMLESLSAANPAALPEPGGGGDEFDATPQDGPTRTQPGDLWLIGGKHRLLVGDCTASENVERLMGGEKPDLLHTDPPYGISIVTPKDAFAAADTSGGSKPFGSVASTHRPNGTGWLAPRPVGTTQKGPRTQSRSGESAPRLGTGLDGPKSKNQIVHSNLYPVIQGDDKPFDPTRLLGFAPVVILWGANYFADKLPISSCWICWDKREDITRNSFADGELAWCSRPSPVRIFHHLWNGLHKGSQHGERRTHPTEKPVALFAEVGGMFASGGLWVDLYAGTGAQVVAAHRTGARCYACEIEPRYADVVLKRAEAEGLTVKRLTS